MKKIAIFQRDLDFGGIQRSLYNLISFVDLSMYEIDLYLFKAPTICSLDDLSSVNVFILEPLNYLNRVIDIRLMMGAYKKALPEKEYDVAIDFNSYSNECAICALTVNAKKRVLWIHSDLESEYKNTKKFRILYTFFKAKYKLFDEFVAVSDGIIDPFCRITGVSRDKIRRISNSIDTRNIFIKADKKIDFSVDPKTRNFIYVGRFSQEKAIDSLIDYFTAALELRQDMQLYLLGDGAEKAAILAQIDRLKLGDYITVLPATDNPFAFMQQMDALILTSRHEGQGIVLWEAKALGLKLIFEKRLEKYNNYMLTGTEDIVAEIASTEKCEKHRDALDEYNQQVKNGIYSLLDEQKNNMN